MQCPAVSDSAEAHCASPQTSRKALGNGLRCERRLDALHETAVAVDGHAVLNEMRQRSVVDVVEYAMAS